MALDITLQEENDIFSPSEADDLADAVSKRESLEKSLANGDNPWIHSAKAMEAERAAMRILSTKTGMYAKIPIACKGEDCPFADTCQLLPYDLAPYGEYCPMETAQIKMKAAQYSEDIDYDNSSFVDRTLLSEIVGYDIMLDRCRSLMSKEGTPVIDVVIGISQDGDEIKQPAVSKAWEAYERIVKKRNEAYQLLMLTRKDNKGTAESTESSLSKILAETTIEAEAI